MGNVVLLDDVANGIISADEAYQTGYLFILHESLPLDVGVRSLKRSDSDTFSGKLTGVDLIVLESMGNGLGDISVAPYYKKPNIHPVAISFTELNQLADSSGRFERFFFFDDGGVEYWQRTFDKGIPKYPPTPLDIIELEAVRNHSSYREIREAQKRIMQLLGAYAD